MMRLALEAEGYDVEDAPDGTKGLELFGDGSRFDAVVLDQKMPGLDGIETLRQMRRRSPDAAIVMATAFGSIELAVEAMKAGARDFLKKPLTPALLRDAVAAALSKREIVREATRAAAQPAAARVPAAPPPLIPAGPHEVWTVNGFFIRALVPDEGAPPNEHRFTVRHAGNGPRGDVLVTIALPEVSRIARLSGRPSPPGAAFWRQQAERALMNHLFRHAALPSAHHLVVESLGDDAVLLAREWNRE
jgi:CheY-like chemotaxis protein